MMHFSSPLDGRYFVSAAICAAMAAIASLNACRASRSTTAKDSKRTEETGIARRLDVKAESIPIPFVQQPKCKSVQEDPRFWDPSL